jgi:sugar/nucleoside kinase (ribokinase family)
MFPKPVKNKVDTVPLGTGKAAPVLIVGSVAFDDIITPTKTGRKTLGGSASYASIAASFFAPVQLVGVVGNDFEPEFISRLENRGICLEGLQHDSSGPTFFWAGEYADNFNVRRTVDIKLNVFERFRPVLPQSYQISQYVLLGNIGPDLQMHVLNQLRGEAFVVADTIDLWIKTRFDELLALIGKIDCYAINESEATLMTGERNTINAGWRLLEMGPRMAIVKKGEHGAYLFHPDGLFALPAYPVTALQDPTGAGDAFAGALLGYLAAVNDTSFTALKQAMLYATATASLTVEAFSCDGIEKTGVAEISRRYEALASMIST